MPNHGTIENPKEPQGHPVIVAIITIICTAGLTNGGTYYFTRHVEKKAAMAEEAALKSEAGYLCHAMSWQVFYLASDQDPGTWQDVNQAKGTLDLNDVSRPWSRPSWFPFRTPVWSGLKDKIGDLSQGDLSQSEVRVFADFFNRVEFLDVLRLRRHCFQSSKPEFWRIYMCAIKNELSICDKQQYGEPQSLDGSVNFYERFSVIAEQLNDGLCKTKPWPAPGTKSQDECDSDVWPPKAKN